MRYLQQHRWFKFTSFIAGISNRFYVHLPSSTEYIIKVIDQDTGQGVHLYMTELAGIGRINVREEHLEE
jgi:hypothetical protein